MPKTNRLMTLACVLSANLLLFKSCLIANPDTFFDSTDSIIGCILYNMQLRPILEDPESNMSFSISNNNAELILKSERMLNVPKSLHLESNKFVSVWRSWRSRYIQIKNILLETTRNFFKQNIADRTSVPGYLYNQATILSKHMEGDLDETHQIDIQIIADVLYDRYLNLDVIGIYGHADFPTERFLFKEKCCIHIWIKVYETTENSVVHYNDSQLSMNHYGLGVCCNPILFVYGNSCSQGYLKGSHFIRHTLSDILNLEISYTVSSNSDRINQLVLTAVCNLSSDICQRPTSIHHIKEQKTS